MGPRRILHLVGSPTSRFYCELSELYAAGCIHALADPTRYGFVIAYVTPTGAWRFPASLDRADIDAAAEVGLADAIAIMAAQRIDVALPQMFCREGMTTYRALLELLDIPYLGNRPLQMAIAADKAKTKAIAAAAGVRAPRAELLRRGEVPTLKPPVVGIVIGASALLRGEVPTLKPPVVVKPNDADNSDGVSLVAASDDYPAALALAFDHADAVLVEEYVALGREVRCGIVVRDGEMICLPLEEYAVDAVSQPIRRRSDKLRRDAGDALTLAAKDGTKSWIVPVEDAITPAVWAAARHCHVALGCRHYSLFDFRIDPQGEPWLLEAGLYCSFSPQSVIVTMMAANQISLEEFFRRSVEAVSR